MNLKESKMLKLMILKRAAKFLSIFSIFLLLGVCVTGPAFADKIKVGVLLPLSGKLAKFGEIEKNSFLMAVEEINNSGGVNGKKIDLIIEDTRGKPGGGRSAMEKLISKDNVIIVGGGYSSSVTWATAAIAQQKKVPFLINTGSADRITEQGWKYIFRLNPPVSELRDAFASFLNRVASDVKTVAILHEDSIFGQSGSRKYAKKFKRMGLKVVMNEGYDINAFDLKPILVKAKAKNPDLVYMISYLDPSLLLQQARELNFNPKLFMGGTIVFTLPEFQENAGPASDYVYSATLWTPSAPYPGARAYYEKFMAKFNSPTDYHGAEAYAGMYVIADALKRSGTLTPDGVRDALAATDMMTVFGPVRFISYRQKTQQNRLPTFLVQWINGKLETVWPSNVSTGKYIYPVPNWDQRLVE